MVALAPRLAARGIRIRGVRIDSGDLADHAFQVRAILDAGGLGETTIFASGNLDEYALRDLASKGAPIDGYGIGTALTTSADRPFLDCAYKLQEYAGKPRRKRSEGKATWPGRRQVWRSMGADGRIAGDVAGRADESFVGEPLLVPVMRKGKRLTQPSLAEVRAHAARQLASLPDAVRDPDAAPATYPVVISAALRALADEIPAG